MITAKWLKIMKSFDPQLSELKSILDKVELEESYCPHKDNILEFAKFSLIGAKVVILGMDPYPNKGDAHGLSFSTKSNKCPASLNRIFLTLGIDEHLDLTYWAIQGIILLNTALTVKTGQPGSHIKTWAPWMNKLITALSTECPDLIWCLWGSHAQEKEAFIKSGKILKWCHPVAPTVPSFSKCDHFKIISQQYPDIIWDFSQTETHLFTDCSAPNNQSKYCRASWGVLCTKGIYLGRSWGEVLETVKIPFKVEITEARPTNIRAEGLALVQALKIAKICSGIKVKIFTDSMFWIDMLKNYIPNWVANKIAFVQKKNSDIVTSIWDAYCGNHAEIIFVPCWHDRPEPDHSSIDYYHWKGNKDVEAVAQKLLNPVVN